MIRFMFLGANGSAQERGSGNSSILISGGGAAICVDLSVNLAAAVEADVDAVFLTHEHIDHVYGLPSLLHQLWIRGRRRPLEIFVPAGMEPLANGLVDLFGLRAKKGIFDIEVLSSATAQVGGLRVSSFPVDHSRFSIGLVAEEGRTRLCYTSDCRPMEAVPALAEGCGTLIHEASGASVDEEALVLRGHSSGLDAGRMARRLGARELFLCHLPLGDEAKSSVLEEARTVFPATFLPEPLVWRAAAEREEGTP